MESQNREPEGDLSPALPVKQDNSPGLGGRNKPNTVTIVISFGKFVTRQALEEYICHMARQEYDRIIVGRWIGQ